MKHLDYFGVEIDGNADDFMDKLASAGLIEPESELSRIVRQTSDPSNTILLDNSDLFDYHDSIGFIYTSAVGLAKQVLWAIPSIAGEKDFQIIVNKIKQYYGTPTLFKYPNATWLFECGTILISDTFNQEYGIIVSFSDKQNADVDD